VGLERFTPLVQDFRDLYIPLKVVGNENQRGSGTWHIFGIGLRPWRSMFFYLLI
jgi:hypothetical protein